MLQKTSASQPVSEKDFRYPGPTPQTKEAALVMLADAVEAASKTLAADYAKGNRLFTGNAWKIIPCM